MLDETARSATSAADQRQQETAAVAAAATDAGTGLQNVSTGTEDLAVAIGEIARQVVLSSKISGKAPGDATQEIDARVAQRQTATRDVVD